MDRLLAERMRSNRSVSRNPCLGKRKNAWIRKGILILRLKSYLEFVNMDVKCQACFCAISQLQWTDHTVTYRIGNMLSFSKFGSMRRERKSREDAIDCIQISGCKLSGRKGSLGK